MTRRSASGFTLLEIMVVLAVFGFLLVGLSQTVRFGITSWRQQARLSDGKSDLEAVDRTLRAIIQNLAPGDAADRPAVIGSTSGLTGLTMLREPGAGPMPTPIEAELALSGSRLVLRWRPYHHVEPLQPPIPPRETDLIGNVSHVAFSYWEPSGVWSSTWSDSELPMLIRLRLTFDAERATRWPDIIVAPLLSRP